MIIHYEGLRWRDKVGKSTNFLNQTKAIKNALDVSGRKVKSESLARLSPLQMPCDEPKIVYLNLVDVKYIFLIVLHAWIHTTSLSIIFKCQSTRNLISFFATLAGKN